jgi:type IV secretory pathway protease TraF
MAVAAIGTTMDQAMTPRFVWNASASVPIGLYKVHPAHHLTLTALAVAYPPEPLAGWLEERRYLPRGVPLIKPVLALDGHTVCRVGPLITVVGRETGVAHENDHSGRPLPFWQDCHVIGQSESFLMNPHEPASLDGPYFGPLHLGVGHAKGAVDLELNRPTDLLVWTSSPSCRGQRGGRVAFRSAAVVQLAATVARFGSWDGSSGFLGGRRFCGWLRSIRRFAVEMTIGLLRRERGLFDHGDRRCLGVSAGQSIGEQRAPLFGRCRFCLLHAIQRQPGSHERVDLRAIHHEPGLVAGTARCDMHGMAIEPRIKQDDGPIHRHALHSVHGAGIGPAEPGTTAFVGDVGGDEADAAAVDDRFYTDGAGCRPVFRRISVDGGHRCNRTVDGAELIVAKLEANFVAGRDFKTG